MTKNSKKLKIKLIIPVVSILCTLGSFSVGFSMWTLILGDEFGILGVFNADKGTQEVTHYNLFSINSTPTFTSREGYGFLSGTEYVNNADLSWTISFNGSTASDVIKSMSLNKVWFSFSLTLLTDTSSISDFSISSMTLTRASTAGGVATILPQTVNNKTANVTNNGSFINQQWNLTDVNNTFSAISYTLTIPFVFNSSQSTRPNNFPNLNTNKLTLSLLAGEYKDA